MCILTRRWKHFSLKKHKLSKDETEKNEWMAVWKSDKHNLFQQRSTVLKRNCVTVRWYTYMCKWKNVRVLINNNHLISKPLNSGWTFLLIHNISIYVISFIHIFFLFKSVVLRLVPLCFHRKYVTQIRYFMSCNKFMNILCSLKWWT